MDGSDMERGVAEFCYLYVTDDVSNPESFVEVSRCAWEVSLPLQVLMSGGARIERIPRPDLETAIVADYAHGLANFARMLSHVRIAHAEAFRRRVLGYLRSSTFQYSHAVLGCDGLFGTRAQGNVSQYVRLLGQLRLFEQELDSTLRYWDIEHLTTYAVAWSRTLPPPFSHEPARHASPAHRSLDERADGD